MLLRQIHWNEVKGLDGISGDHFKKSVETAFNFFYALCEQNQQIEPGRFHQLKTRLRQINDIGYAIRDMTLPQFRGLLSGAIANFVLEQQILVENALQFEELDSLTALEP